MELEFDNEIDALLRKARDGRGVLVGDTMKLHLDADEISAFAENAVPNAAKLAYVAHFADCDGCRRTLSSIILLNSEAGTETAPAVAAPSASALPAPWYRKLFLFPNLAYVMGSLVILFGGFLAVSILLSPGEKDVSSDYLQISQEEPAASGPNAGSEVMSYNTNSSVANSTNSTANTMKANSAGSASNLADTRTPLNTAKPTPESAASTDVASAPTANGFVLDGVATTAAPPAPAKDQPVILADKNDVGKTEAQRSLPPKESERQMLELKGRRVMPPAAGGPSKKMKAVRREEQNESTITDSSVMNESDSRANSSATSLAAGRKQVSGRSFELKQGVWYDSAYRGQATINIRRGSDDFKKLNSVLRSIGESLNGTVIVVWNERAYRIQ